MTNQDNLNQAILAIASNKASTDSSQSRHLAKMGTRYSGRGSAHYQYTFPNEQNQLTVPGYVEVNPAANLISQYLAKLIKPKKKTQLDKTSDKADRSSDIYNSSRQIVADVDISNFKLDPTGESEDSDIIKIKQKNIINAAKKSKELETTNEGTTENHMNNIIKNCSLKDIKFNLERGKVLAIVGESGSGKSTLANTLMGLMPYQKGKINLAKDLLAQEMQLIFQDPSSAMNPRWSIQEILSEGLLKYDAKKLLSILDAVQMPISCLKHYPHELSGGQRQRIAIARGLLAAPKLLICDEPTSALDISVQAQILNLLQQLKEDMGLSYILITHDLDVVGYMADHVLILKDGEIVEQGLVTEIWNNPKEDYTKTLLASCE